MEPSPDLITRTAQEMFHITYLFPYQRLVISNILRKAGVFSEEEAAEAPPNQIVLLPTGAGKSLCFMLPALLLPGLTVVVFPLLGLMADQLRRVKEAGMTGAVLKGGMNRKDKEELWQKIYSGKVQMLLTNPEMLTLPEVQEKLIPLRISHMVIDEAHTVPEWGETFRPSCLKLGEAFEKMQIDQTTAFTATASPLILEKIQTYLFAEKTFNLVRANPDRTNIHYAVKPVLSRMRSLTDVLKHAEKPALVFCPTRRSCEKTAFQLRERLDEKEIRYYHAGLSPDLRKAREEWFFHSPSGIMTATCAYGLGMDKGNIRTVIHLSLPSSVEAYLQESGRAGRDRNPCRAVLLYHPEDREREQNNPSRELQERYEKLIAFADDSTRCRRESLLAILEAEPEDCVSCDVCRGEVEDLRPFENVILSFVKKYRKRFTAKQFRSFLLGRHSPFLREGKYHKSPEFGILYDWDPDDLEEVIKTLVSKGKISVIKRGSWKGKLKI